jgi:predicted enzyme related to lactoylglutathione lyase
MSTQVKPGAVIYAKNLPVVSEFYAGVLGFEVAHSEAGHVVLDSPWFQLVLLSIPKAIASAIEITSPPVRREETPIKLVFIVPSLAVCREAAAKLGGEVNPSEREWRFQRSIVCDGCDPEGNVFQLRQNAG